jgi:hypothetical protein
VHVRAGRAVEHWGGRSSLPFPRRCSNR